jgi:twitching motility protein PilT
MLLSDLQFSDLFLSGTPDMCWHKESPGSLSIRAIPPDLFDEVTLLRRQLLSTIAGKRDSRILWSGMSMRVERMETATGDIIFICRRFAIPADGLAKLGFPLNIVTQLLSPAIRSGMVLFVGATGTGKTTAAVAYTKEWLEKNGGICWTVENPVEINFSGPHGSGVVFQTEVDTDDQFGVAIQGILRSSPNVIMLGEIREASAAREAVRAATSGHLVIATLHASDIQSGLARLAEMLTDKGTLADALKSVFYLQLHVSPDLPNKRKLIVEPLWVTGVAADGIRSILRAGNFHMLKSEIERQKKSIMNGGAP